MPSFSSSPHLLIVATILVLFMAIVNSGLFDLDLKKDIVCALRRPNSINMSLETDSLLPSSQPPSSASLSRLTPELSSLDPSSLSREPAKYSSGHVVLSNLAREADTVRGSLRDNVVTTRIPRCSGPRGIVIFVLSNASSSLQDQLDSALATAMQLRPLATDIPIVILTDAPEILARTVAPPFDCIQAVLPLHVASNAGVHSVVWLSLWHLAVLPFGTTLVLPHGTAICAQLAVIWTMLDDVDLLVTFTGGTTSKPALNAGLFALKAGPGIDVLVSNLRRLLLIGDAKTALFYAVTVTLSMPDFRAALLPSFMTFQTSYSSPAVSQSLVMSGNIMFSEPPAKTSTFSQLKARCDWLKAADHQPLIYFWNATARSAGTVTAVTCHASGLHCDGFGLNWMADAGKPIPFPSAITPSQVQLAVRAHSAGLSYGVTFFGYSSNAAKVHGYIAEIEAAAWGVKRYNPGLSIALFTNAPLLPRPPFDHVVRIADADTVPPPSLHRRGSGWNILTRVRYHARSPYNLSLQMDTDRLACRDLSRVFHLLADGWDFLSTSAGSLPTMDHGVIGMRKSPALLALLQMWGDRMVERHDEGRDEQAALVDVRDKVPGLRMGFLSPSWQAKYYPANNTAGEKCVSDRSLCRYQHTLVVEPGLPFLWSGGTTSLAGQEGTCAFLSTGVDRKRLYLWDAEGNISHRAVFSSDECNAITGNLCHHTELFWGPYPEVSTVSDYMEKHFHPRSV